MTGEFAKRLHVTPAANPVRLDERLVPQLVNSSVMLAEDSTLAQTGCQSKIWV